MTFKFLLKLFLWLFYKTTLVVCAIINSILWLRIFTKAVLTTNQSKYILKEQSGFKN